MYKTAFIGDRESVLGFISLGVKAVEFEFKSDTENTDALERLISRLAGEGFAVIFVTEQIAEMIPATMEKYRNQRIPALIPVPGKSGSTGYGMANVKKSVERAVGADIL